MDLLDAARGEDYRAELFDRLGSTNDEAMSRARAGDPGRLWVLARRQTKGRGRMGRAWESPEGNLYASLLLVSPATPALCPQLGFVAGVALHRAVSALTGLPRARLAIKWPNDLLLDGAKLAGILIEGAFLPNGAQAVVIGIGVNLAHHPQDTLYAATDLAGHGCSATREEVGALLIREVAAALRTWDAGAGFAAIRAEWLARAGGIGQPVVVRRPDGERRGMFDSIAEDGALVLRQGDALVRIEAGDVFLLPAAAPTGPASFHSGADR